MTLLRATTPFKQRALHRLTSVLLGLLLAGLTFKYVLTPVVIPTGSMSPSIEAHSVAALHRTAYLWSTPAHGDIVVFKTQHDDTWYIKRVIGIEGDHLSVDNHMRVTRNGRLLEYQTSGPHGTFQEETYRVKLSKGLSSEKEFRVPAGTIFVMGDNRPRSLDSRALGPIPIQNIAGKAVAIWKLPKQSHDSEY